MSRRDPALERAMMRILTGPPLGIGLALPGAIALDGLPWQAWLIAAIGGLALTLTAEAPAPIPTGDRP